MNDVYQYIVEDDLKGDLRLLSDICGLDTVRVLMKNLGGLSFYIPKITHLDSFVFRYINHNKNKNFKEIAKDLNVSQQFVKTVIKRNKPKRE